MAISRCRTIITGRKVRFCISMLLLSRLVHEVPAAPAAVRGPTGRLILPRPSTDQNDTAAAAVTGGDKMTVGGPIGRLIRPARPMADLNDTAAAGVAGRVDIVAVNGTIAAPTMNSSSNAAPLAFLGISSPSFAPTSLSSVRVPAAASKLPDDLTPSPSAQSAQSLSPAPSPAGWEPDVKEANNMSSANATVSPDNQAAALEDVKKGNDPLLPAMGSRLVSYAPLSPLAPRRSPGLISGHQPSGRDNKDDGDDNGDSWNILVPVFVLLGVAVIIILHSRGFCPACVTDCQRASKYSMIASSYEMGHLRTVADGEV